MAKLKEKLLMPITDRRISTQPIRMMIRKMTRNLRRSHSIRAKKHHKHGDINSRNIDTWQYGFVHDASSPFREEP